MDGRSEPVLKYPQLSLVVARGSRVRSLSPGLPAAAALTTAAHRVRHVEASPPTSPTATSWPAWPPGAADRCRMTARTRVKFCGLTRPDDVRAAVDLGVDAIGLVFHPASPRAVDLPQAVQLASLVPAFVTLVGLFVDASAARVAEVLRQVPLGALQFHGQEPPANCQAPGRPWIKALAVRPGFDLDAALARYGDAASLLLDTYDPTLPGGTGRRFDWELIPPALAPRIILAGGLDAANVAAAIARVRPHAVDVSGGLEAARGRKDAHKMAQFMKGVRDGDQHR